MVAGVVWPSGHGSVDGVLISISASVFELSFLLVPGLSSVVVMLVVDVVKVVVAEPSPSWLVLYSILLTPLLANLAMSSLSLSTPLQGFSLSSLFMVPLGTCTYRPGILLPAHSDI